MSLYIFLPHLEYCVHLWSLNFRKAVVELEEAHRRYELLLYKAKISRLELFSLEKVTERIEALTKV